MPKQSQQRLLQEKKNTYGTFRSPTDGIPSGNNNSTNLINNGLNTFGIFAERVDQGIQNLTETATRARKKLKETASNMLPGYLNSTYEAVK